MREREELLTPERAACGVRRRAALGALALAPAVAGTLLSLREGTEAKKKQKKKNPTPPAVTPPQPAGRGQYVCPVRAWGSEGAGQAQFKFPKGIAVAPTGDVYVADESNNTVPRCNANGEFVLSWGTRGSGNAQFIALGGVAIAPHGNVYVADSGYDRVQWCTPTGAWLGTISSASIPASVPDNRVRYPESEAVAPNGTVYLTSFGYRILRFTSTGSFIGRWGHKGTAQGEFTSLEHIAIGLNGDVYATDETVCRVQRFNASGSFLGLWGGSGSGDGQFLRPWGIAADASGNIAVSDIDNDRIQTFSPDGAFLAKWGTLGSGLGHFVDPTNLAIAPNGNFYVTDAGNKRVHQFAFPPAPVPAEPKPPKRKKK